jgi:hypothetical protein
MSKLQKQVTRGQASLGQLIRQFLAINDFKHVQLMSMANILTGERWLHSSQISTLKRGATKNLTGYPLYSLALVNKKIWEINNDVAGIPRGTRAEDWEYKTPMLREDGQPLDIGDLWRIYFGDMPAPLFNNEDGGLTITDDQAKIACDNMRAIFVGLSAKKQVDSLKLIEEAMRFYPSSTDEQLRLVKSMLLGITDMPAEELMQSIEELSEMFTRLSSRTIAINELIYPDQDEEQESG